MPKEKKITIGKGLKVKRGVESKLQKKPDSREVTPETGTV